MFFTLRVEDRKPVPVKERERTGRNNSISIHLIALTSEVAAPKNKIRCGQIQLPDLANLLLRNFIGMGVLKQIAEYLYIRKPDPDRPNSLFVKYMHGINRLSLLLFIVALIILAIKLFVRK